MNETTTTTTPRPAQRLLILGFIAVALLLSLAEPASAHTCSSNTHEGCNGHQCDDGEAHDHQTHHDVGGNHFCRTTASCGSGSADAGGSPISGTDTALCAGAGGSGSGPGSGLPLLGLALGCQLPRGKGSRAKPKIPRGAIAALTAALLLPVLAGPASAHTCAFADHLVCNGHQCPDDLEGQLIGHDHQTLHPAPGGIHWCQSGTSSPATQAVGVGVFVLRLVVLVPAWVVWDLIT